MVSKLRLGTYRKSDSAIKRYLDVDPADVWSVHVIGAPGMGKSHFEATFAEACVDAGEGVIVFDPKGQLAKDIVLGTKHRDSLVYVAPHEASASGHYWALNAWCEITSR